MSALATARAHPEWSRIGPTGTVDSGADAPRASARDALAGRLDGLLGASAVNGG
jgi:hypothetical protein